MSAQTLHEIKVEKHLLAADGQKATDVSAEFVQYFHGNNVRSGESDKSVHVSFITAYYFHGQHSPPAESGKMAQHQQSRLSRR